MLQNISTAYKNQVKPDKYYNKSNLTGQMFTAANYADNQNKNAVENNSDKLKKDYINNKSGIIAALYDSIKNLTGVGNGSKKALNKLEELKTGAITEKETEKYLKDYKYNQKDSTEITTDALTGLLSFGFYSSFKKLEIISNAFVPKKFIKTPKNIGLVATIAIGAITKPLLKKINMIGVNKEDRKKERTRTRDFITGAIDGALSPIIALKSLFVGVPIALGLNSLSRYLSIKKDEKSPGDYINQQASSIGLKGLTIMGFVIGLRKNHGSLNSWRESSLKASENIKHLKTNQIPLQISDLQELMLTLFNQMKEKLFIILKNPFLSEQSKMLQLEKYNLFIPKTLQMIPDNLLAIAGEKNINKIIKIPGIKNIAELVEGFKSDCPTSRTIKEARKIVSKTYKDKYTIQGEKVLGTGTVAETYLAKETATGKEVVIKIIKKGMSAAKIEKDRNKIIEILDNCNIKDSKQLDFYKKQVNYLFDAWIKEIDLSLEGEAARLLGANAREYNAIKPIEIKNNIYVMEKAPGVQFNKFVNYLENSGTKLTKKEAISLSINYLEVFFEQLLSVPKEGGKIMHADPHPGNIFIDLKNTKKPLTFIDTGNVLRYTPKEAITNVVNHLDYIIGNSAGIAKAMHRNATLPEGMSENEAVEILTKELDDKVYNMKNKLPLNLFQDINSFCLNIMNKNRIVPNPNNTNLLKAEMTYILNLTSLKGIRKHVELDEKLDKKDIDFLKEQSGIAINEIRTAIGNSFINNRQHTMSELKSRIKHIEENKELFLTTLKSFYEQ